MKAKCKNLAQENNFFTWAYRHELICFCLAMWDYVSDINHGKPRNSFNFLHQHHKIGMFQNQTFPF